MPHRLLIRLFADGSAEWLAQARDGAVVQGPQAGLPDSSVAPTGDEVVLLLPAEQVLLLDTPKIGGSRAQRMQALPFAIEEQLIAAVETQHVAFDEPAGSERLSVAVVARARIDGALARLRAVGLLVDRVYAESQLLPYAPATGLIDGERVLLRWSRSGALTQGTADLPQTLALLQESDAVADGFHWIGRSAEAVPDVCQPLQPIDHPLRWFAGRLDQVDGPSLLQGDYRPPRRQAQTLGLWRWAAGLAAAALLIGLAQALIERNQLQAQVQARSVEMEQLLRQAAPDVQRVVDPVAQLRVELQRLGQRDDGGLLPLLARIAPALSGSGRYTLEAIEYRGDTLELVITAADVAALDSLRESLAALPPLRVELTAATPGSRGVEGRLRIRGGAA